MINWLKNNSLWLSFKWKQDALPGGILAFLVALRVWWQRRPQRTRCAFCGIPIWWNGQRDPDTPMEVYCSEACAFYGPQEEYQEDSDGPPF